MKTTFKRIKEFLPCENGWRKLLAYYKPENLDSEITIEEIVKSNGIKDAVWALRCIEGSDVKWVYLFCADIAESVLSIFENKYPEDNRPRKAVEAIRLFVELKISQKELKIAAYAADGAAYAADDAAADAAFYDDTGIVADAVAYAADGAAYAAADSAAEAVAYAGDVDARDKKWDEIKTLLNKYI